MVELTELQKQVKQVAWARAELRKAMETKEREMEAWEVKNAVLLFSIGGLASIQYEAEAVLREMTLEFYNETGNKKPCEGVGVRELVKLEYDPVEALNYAKEHSVALKLDIAAFEKMAKIPELRPSFVVIKTESQATISQDLTGVLKEVEGNATRK